MKKYIYIGLILCAMAVSPYVASAQLTSVQRDAIIQVLYTFGADTGVINNVYTALGGTGSITPLLQVKTNAPSFIQPVINSINGHTGSSIKIHAGDEVNIGGTHLFAGGSTADGLTVRFGGLTCPIKQSSSSTMLVCTTPANVHVGETYPVYIYTIFGVSNTVKVTIVDSAVEIAEPVLVETTTESELTEDANTSSDYSIPLQITYPTKSTSWILGDTYRITWKDANPDISWYSVFLENEHVDSVDSIYLGTVYPSNADSGTFAWTVPTYLPESSQYRIRFSGRGQTDSQYSAVFTINKKPLVVVNEKPIINSVASIGSAMVGDVVSLRVFATDKDGTEFTFIVDWGDGVVSREKYYSPSNGQISDYTLKHVYQKAGSYDQKISVEDNEGLQSGVVQRAIQINSSVVDTVTTVDVTQTQTQTVVAPVVKKPLVCGSLGDVNGDGYISGTDVEQVSLHIIQTILLAGLSKTNADVDGNGAITRLDKSLIAAYVEGTRSTLPGCVTEATQTDSTQSADTTTTADEGLPFTLSTARLGSGELTLTYSKDFSTCAHVLKGGSYAPIASACQTGVNNVQTFSGSNWHVGDSVRLCNGNDYGMCTDSVTIMSAETAFGRQNTANAFGSFREWLGSIF